jgi:hypothetical protein
MDNDCIIWVLRRPSGKVDFNLAFETEKDADDTLDMIESISFNDTYRDRGFTKEKIKIEVVT